MVQYLINIRSIFGSRLGSMSGSILGWVLGSILGSIINNGFHIQFNIGRLFMKICLCHHVPVSHYRTLTLQYPLHVLMPGECTYRNLSTYTRRWGGGRTRGFPGTKKIANTGKIQLNYLKLLLRKRNMRHQMFLCLSVKFIFIILNTNIL